MPSSSHYVFKPDVRDVFKPDVRDVFKPDVRDAFASVDECLFDADVAWTGFVKQFC